MSGHVPTTERPTLCASSFGYTQTRCTPLHYAAGAGDVELCKRLIEKGARVNTWDFYQYTAVDYAKQSGATDCVAYLEDVSAPGASSGGEQHTFTNFSARRVWIVKERAPSRVPAGCFSHCCFRCKSDTTYRINFGGALKMSMCSVSLYILRC